MRNEFIETLASLAETDERIFLLTGDLGYGVVEAFCAKHQDRFLNCGVSEQSMLGIAAGLSREGFKPFVYSLANFPTFRCFEQIRNDISYHDLDVSIVAVGAGVSYGSLGYSHHAFEDLALMRTLPNATLISPSSTVEATDLLEMSMSQGGLKYFRLAKGFVPANQDFKRPSIWGEEVCRHASKLYSDQEKVALVSHGELASSVDEAIKTMPSEAQERVAHWSTAVLSALSTPFLETLAGFRKIAVVEEHVEGSGLYAELVLKLASNGLKTPPSFSLGLKSDLKSVVGDHSYLLKQHRLDIASLSNTIQMLLGSLDQN